MEYINGRTDLNKTLMALAIICGKEVNIIKVVEKINFYLYVLTDTKYLV